MANKPIKMRAKLQDGVTTIKAVMPHPMESGLRKDKKTGEPIPAQYIQKITCEYQGKAVLSAYTGPGMSADPYLSFSFAGGAKGDKVTLSWADNLGNSNSAEVQIK
jgi:sulfur-oxidizing protein SoxZ